MPNICTEMCFLLLSSPYVSSLLLTVMNLLPGNRISKFSKRTLTKPNYIEMHDNVLRSFIVFPRLRPEPTPLTWEIPNRYSTVLTRSAVPVPTCSRSALHMLRLWYLIREFLSLADRLWLYRQPCWNDWSCYPSRRPQYKGSRLLHPTPKMSKR